MAIPLLLGLGVSSLSVNPGAVPGTKALVRALRHNEMETLATEALGCARVSEVRALVREALPAEFAHGIATG
jgi:phosphocarrier protein FPr